MAPVGTHIVALAAKLAMQGLQLLTIIPLLFTGVGWDTCCAS